MPKTLHARTLWMGLAATLLAVASIAAAPRKPVCNVVGTWNLVSNSVDGVTAPFDPQWKVVTRRHFMWISQPARRDTLPKATAIDTLRRTRLAGGAGTYTLSGNSYTEHIDMFVDPEYVGTDWKATCRTEGNRWTHSYTFKMAADSTHPARDVKAVEVWQRLD